MLRAVINQLVVHDVASPDWMGRPQGSREGDKMFQYHGKTALITGASSGIGAAFARTLAARGANVILVARSEGRLQALADEVMRDHGVRAAVIAADLTRPDAARDLRATVDTRGLAVDLLVNNAGFGTYAPFETLAPERDHDEVTLNVAAVVDLTHLFLPAMLAKGDGAVVNVASVAAFMPGPYSAVYGATKAFVLSFSEALWAECRGRGVRVLALCPGATATEFFNVLGTDAAATLGAKRTPAQVVETGLRALERNRSYAVDGLANYLMVQAPRVVPRGLAARLVARAARPRQAAPQRGAVAQHR